MAVLLRLGATFTMVLSVWAAGTSTQLDLHAQAKPTDSWLQWGGPNRNFIVNSTGLADKWAETGPPVLWSRPLGTGHSAILVDEAGSTRCIAPATAAPNRARGTPKRPSSPWTRPTARRCGNTHIPSRREDFSFGAGPHSTPLIVGDRLFTIGTNKQLFAFDKTQRQGALVARFHQGLQLARAADPAGRQDRIRLQPDCLSRHDHLQRRRPGTVGDGVPPKRRRRGVEERRLSHVGSAADPDFHGRPRSARGLWRRHGERDGSRQRPHPLVARPRSRQRSELRARRSSDPTTSCSCRRRIAPAAARSS